MVYQVEFEREDDGRWIADVPALPGVMCYGATQDEALERVKELAARVVQERIEHGEVDGEARHSLHFGAA